MMMYGMRKMADPDKDVRVRTTKTEPFELETHYSELQPDIDPARMNQLVEELEDEAIMAKMRDGR